MQYIKQIPLENKEKTKELSESGWLRLKEPNGISAAVLYSLPIAFLLMFMNGVWLYLITPVVKEFVHSEGLMVEFQINITKYLVYIGGVFLFLFLHEMVHALFIPDVVHSRKTYWGLNGLFGFVYTEEKISKSRFVLISVMPLVVLSFLFPVLLSLAGISNWFVVFLCILNAGGACVDIFNMILILVQVPSKGIIVNNGFATYYKK